VLFGVALSGLVPRDFSWQSCGSTSSPFVIKSFTLAPDPLVLGANITFSGAVSLSEQVTAAQLEVTLEKKILGIWTEIPCIDNVGSCTYDNVCTFLTPDNGLCKPPFSNYDIPCQCPVAAGSWAMPETTVFAKNPGLSWLTDGDFYAEAQAYDQNGNELACYEVYVSLSSS